MRRGALDRPQRRQVAALQNFDPTHDSYGSILLKKGLVNHRAELEDTRQLYLAAIAEHPGCMRPDGRSEPAPQAAALVR
jgi:hypothetical protein